MTVPRESGKKTDDFTLSSTGELSVMKKKRFFITMIKKIRTNVFFPRMMMCYKKTNPYLTRCDVESFIGKNFMDACHTWQ